MTEKLFKCGCGEKFATARDLFAHRDAIQCPVNPPSRSLDYPTWALGIGHAWLNRPKTEAERLRREEAKERLADLRYNPEYQENARAKREAARLLRLRQREMMKPRNHRKAVAAGAPANPSGKQENTIMRHADTESTGTAETASETKKEKRGGKREPAERKVRTDDRTPVGSVIERQYKGQAIKVKVTEKGFEFEGETYISLSAVAKKILGYHVSGAAFFGLWKAKGETLTVDEAAAAAEKRETDKIVRDAEKNAAPSKKKGKKGGKKKGSKKSKKSKE